MNATSSISMPVRPVLPVYLLALTAAFVTLVIGSYLMTRLIAPSILPYWFTMMLIGSAGWAGVSLALTLRGKPGWVYGLTALVFVGAGAAGVVILQAGILGLIITLLGMVITLIMGVFVWGSVLLNRLGVVSKALPAVPMMLGYVVMLVGVLMIGVTNLAHPPKPALWTDAPSVSEELRYMHDLDQSDRNTAMFILNNSRDQARLQRVVELDAAGVITEPLDQYHAALLLQHSEDAAHNQRAYELAYAAAQAGVPVENTDWLWKAAYDRWMLRTGQPQKYNTQVIAS